MIQLDGCTRHTLKLWCTNRLQSAFPLTPGQQWSYTLRPVNLLLMKSGVGRITPPHWQAAACLFFIIIKAALVPCWVVYFNPCWWCILLKNLKLEVWLPFHSHFLNCLTNCKPLFRVAPCMFSLLCSVKIINGNFIVLLLALSNIQQLSKHIQIMGRLKRKWGSEQHMRP